MALLPAKYNLYVSSFERGQSQGTQRTKEGSESLLFGLDFSDKGMIFFEKKKSASPMFIKFLLFWMNIAFSIKIVVIYSGSIKVWSRQILAMLKS